VDFDILKKALDLRYGENQLIDHHSKDYLDKIFQLQLRLPEKNEFEMKKYLDSIASFLQTEEYKLLYSGFPHNPRKIKKIINLVYFLSSNLPDEWFNEQLPMAIIWAICVSEYPKLAIIANINSKIIAHLAIFIFLANVEYGEIQSILERIRDPIKGSNIYFRKEEYYISSNIFETINMKNSIIKGLDYISSNYSAFYFLWTIGHYYFFNINIKNDDMHKDNDIKKNLRQSTNGLLKDKHNSKENETKDKCLDYIFFWINP
ncbi:MAG: hypothetical protein H0U27_14090, partial [Nitrosopumilus sp.]|nr:hypothetical protein [Nitrosopumilus sp.]